MRRQGKLAVICALASLSSGCAYLTTYTRGIDLDGKSSVAMDIKQRVVFSQKLVADTSHERPVDFVATCAEPSPDALTVLGVSGGLSLNDAQSQKSAGATAALAESGSFVGLRTQSIQLLRDAMYRLCEGYAAGAVTAQEFASMQRRYQSTMMGLISIEQLTRPVVAGQVALNAAAAAGAGASADDPAVAAAQKRVDEAQLNVDQAKATQRAADAKVEELRESQQKNSDDLAKARKDKTDTTALAEQQKDLQKSLKAAQQERADAVAGTSTASTRLKEAEFDLASARTAARASASGEARFSMAAASLKQSTSELTDGVRDIVKEINRSYTREGCFSLILKLVEKTQPQDAKAAAVAGTVQQGVALCTTILTADAQIDKDEAAARAADSRRRLVDAETRRRRPQEGEAASPPAKQ